VVSKLGSEGVCFAVFKRNEVCVANISFRFSGAEIELASEQTSAPGVSKKCGEVGRGRARRGRMCVERNAPYFFALARSFVPFTS